MFATQRNPQRDQPSGRQSHKLTGAAARSQSEHHIPPSTCRILESSGFRRAAGRAPHRPGVVGAPIAVSWTSNSAVNLRSWSARVKRRRRRRNLGDLEVEWGRRAVTVLPGSVWTPLERMLEAERQTFFRWEEKSHAPLPLRENAWLKAVRPASMPLFSIPTSCCSGWRLQLAQDKRRGVQGARLYAQNSANFTHKTALRETDGKCSAKSKTPRYEEL